MLRLFFFICLFSVAFHTKSAMARGTCAAVYSFSDGKQRGALQQQPSTASLGYTHTARGCLEICFKHRVERVKEGKRYFRKMSHSCTYNNKVVNQTTQTLY